MDWGKIKSFLWGGVFGGLLGLILAPRRRRISIPDPAVRHLESDNPFSSAPCYRPDDHFT